MTVTITFRGRSNCQCYIKDSPHTISEGGSYGKYTYEYNRNTLDNIHKNTTAISFIMLLMVILGYICYRIMVLRVCVFGMLDTRYKIINNIANTMTDMCAANGVVIWEISESLN